jgi:hypothetical protein
MASDNTYQIDVANSPPQRGVGPGGND